MLHILRVSSKKHNLVISSDIDSSLDVLEFRLLLRAGGVQHPRLNLLQYITILLENCDGSLEDSDDILGYKVDRDQWVCSQPTWPTVLFEFEGRFVVCRGGATTWGHELGPGACIGDD